MPKIKTVRGIENRKVVSQKEWLVARKKLLVKEKKFSKLRDALNLQRRKLPWVKIEKDYVFDGPTGKLTLGDLFGGKSHSFGGKYVELTPHERIRYTDKFDDPNLPGEMQTTITLEKVSCGTELNITQEGVPAVIPAEACYLGWQESLMLLAKLVEAEIPDQP